jgi:hypothetical protein
MTSTFAHSTRSVFSWSRPSTGRHAMPFQLYRIQRGQLAGHWEVADFATILRQLQG